MNILHAVARPLPAAPFIVSGTSALARPKARHEYAQRFAPVASKFGVELDETMSDPMTRSLGAVFAIAGVVLAAGKFPRTAGAVFAVAQVPVALANSPMWPGKGKDRKERLTELTGPLGAARLVGGTPLTAADRDGKPSLSWHRQTNRRHKEALKAAQASQAQ